MKRATIFQLLIVLVIIPVMMVFVGSAYLIVQNEIQSYKKIHGEKNKKIAENIQNILRGQDFELDLIDEGLSEEMRAISKKLVYEYLAETKAIKKVDLKAIRDELRLNPTLVDIYVIDQNGVIVNTTFDKDINLNTFEAFGNEFKDFLLNLFENKEFKTDKFSPEKKTGILRKYSYQATADAKYIVELGFKSNKAKEITRRTTLQLNEIAAKEDNILSVDLFLGGGEEPIPFNNHKAKVSKKHISIFNEVLLYKASILRDTKGDPDYTDAIAIEETEKSQKVHYLYSYIKRANANLFGDSVIRIKSDRSTLDNLISNAILKYTVLFGVIIIVLIVIILIVTKSITNPLDKLVQKVNRISQGNLHERADVKGSKEIYTLADHFNHMLNELEESYNNLEQKVIERTAEISQQKEEIEAQRDQIEDQRDQLVANNKKLKQAYIDIEEQKNHIEDSIHYAKRIQTAILPNGPSLTHAIKEHFILYKPKDIVSGDFYWVAEKNGKSIFVVADCTGHGVPGAFMSMIGNTLLNKIVHEKDDVDTGYILDRLREEVIKALNQKGADHESKDGMDMVVSIFDFKNRKVQFSGAQNPLFIIRNNELIIYKGSKQPIGFFVAGHKPFEIHNIDLEPNDMIYMFTDGYQDQFGGPRDRKFMTKNFKKLLVDINHEACLDQKEILDNTIEDWMFNTNQIDDILIAGIRIS